MSLNNYNQKINKLASLLHNSFVSNYWCYAEQLEDGKYNTVYKPLDHARIRSLIVNNESCLTYQLSSGGLRWVCFDVDIKSEILSGDDYSIIEKEAQEEVISIVTRISSFLSEKDIPYLLEFSGNRGAHVWIIWKDFVEQDLGYTLQQKILEDSKTLTLCKYTAIDRFPQSPQSKSNIGKGVKLPLSKHKKSGFLSNLISSPQDLTIFFDSPLSGLSDKIIDEQAKILEASEVPSWSIISDNIGLNEQLAKQTANSPSYIRQSVDILPGKIPTLETVLKSLSNCKLLTPLITKCTEAELLSEKERSIIVGLLRRITHPQKPNLGEDLLFELFAKQSNFKPNVTKEKISNLNLYPPTCSYLSNSLGLNQQYCNEHSECGIKNSPIELLQNCDLKEESIFSITTKQFEVIRRATSRYAEINDEIDLCFVRGRMEQLDQTTTPNSFIKHLSKKPSLEKYYTFDRPESSEKTRKLVSLGAYNAVISAWFTKILDGLFGLELSPHSYGYRFESSLSKANLFKPWFTQWIKYTKGLSQIIEDGAFDNYWVVKLDIRSYYDQISLTRLRVKLGNGPSEICEDTVKSLDADSRKHYESICATLIEWCREISDSDRGVPQGPAFARYLAELYLMQLDRDIERLMLTHQVQYFRWVDDIFIIAPDQPSAEKVNNFVRSEIESLSLEVNEDKAFIGTVRDYRLSFYEYKNDLKYFVDQTARNSRTASTSIKAQAREELNKMIEQPNGLGFKEENAAFFLTHLKTSPSAVAEFIPELLKVQYGRGSLFRHLFDYIAKDLKEHEFEQKKWDLTNLHGLKLDVFLNSLLGMVTDITLSPKASHNFKKLLDNLKKNTTSTLSKTLLIHLMLRDPNNSEGIEIDEQISINDFIVSLHQLSNSDINDLVLGQILDQLANFSIEETLKILHLLIIDNKLSKAGYRSASDKFFAIILEELRTKDETDPTFDCLAKSQKLLRMYYEICSLSFIAASAKRAEEFKRVWYVLLLQTNELEEWIPGKIKLLGKVDHLEVNPSNLSLLITAGVGGDGVCPGKPDTNRVFEGYRYNLIVLLFALSNKEKIVQSLPNNNQLSAYANKHGMLYLEWLLDEDKHVELYPNKKICLKNIVENNLIILKRETELLVRYSAESKSLFPEYFSPKKTTIESLTLKASTGDSTINKYFNSVFECPSEVSELETLLNVQNLGDVIKLLPKVFNNLRKMRDEYFGGATVPNIFLEGFGIISNTLQPAIPVSALGQKLLIKDKEIFQSQKNDLATAWQILLKKVQSLNSKLLPYEHETQASGENIKNLLPPKAGIDDQVLFLELLGESLPKDCYSSAFAFDHSKMVASVKYAMNVKARTEGATENRVPTLFGLASEVYLSITSEPALFWKHLSFTPISSPSNENLGALINTISSSLAWTAENVYLGITGVDFLKQIREELLAPLSIVSPDKSPLDNSAKVKTEQHINNIQIANIQSGDDYELLLNDSEIISSSGEVVSHQPVKVIRFGAYTSSTEDLKSSHSKDLRQSLVYVNESNNKTVLFIADDIVKAIFEVIRKRSKAYFGKGNTSLTAEQKECLSDKFNFSKTLASEASFRNACEVILRNHFTSGTIKTLEDSKIFLLRWLEQFDESEATTLLEVIAAHQRLTYSDISDFAEKIENMKSESIFFSPKNSSDQGGLQRLFTLTQRGQELTRSLKLDEACSKIAKFEGDKNTLVILSEIILSGSQLEKMLEWHYFYQDNTPTETMIKNDRPYIIHDIKGDFIKGLKKFNKIVILSGAYTQKGANRLKEYLSRFLGFNIESIHVEGVSLEDEKCFFNETEEICADSKNNLKALLNNTDLINSIFNIGDDLDFEKSIQNINDANLVVRPNSVPKKSLKIFTLEPKNVHIPPLFRETKEHY